MLSASTAPFGQRAAQLSKIKSEMKDALEKLGLPPEAVTEEVTLVAIAPWCQVLVKSDRLSRITFEEAEEVGRTITANLLQLATGKARRR